MRKDCDDATLVRVDLERKIETMVEEMEFLKKIHADVSDLTLTWPHFDHFEFKNDHKINFIYV